MTAVIRTDHLSGHFFSSCAVVSRLREIKSVRLYASFATFCRNFHTFLRTQQVNERSTSQTRLVMVRSHRHQCESEYPSVYGFHETPVCMYFNGDRSH